MFNKPKERKQNVGDRFEKWFNDLMSQGGVVVSVVMVLITPTWYESHNIGKEINPLFYVIIVAYIYWGYRVRRDIAINLRRELDERGIQ